MYVLCIKKFRDNHSNLYVAVRNQSLTVSNLTPIFLILVSLALSYSLYLSISPFLSLSPKYITLLLSMIGLIYVSATAGTRFPSPTAETSVIYIFFTLFEFRVEKSLRYTYVNWKLYSVNPPPRPALL